MLFLVVVELWFPEIENWGDHGMTTVTATRVCGYWKGTMGRSSHFLHKAAWYSKQEVSGAALTQKMITDFPRPFPKENSPAR